MNSSLIKRILSAAVGILILWLSVHFFQAAGIYTVCAVAFLALAYECGSLSFESSKVFTFLLPLHALHFTWFYFHPKLENIFLFFILEVCCWIWVNRITSKEENPFYSHHSRLYEFLFYSLVAPSFLLAHLVATPQFESIFFLFFVVASFDTLSYFWGKLLGRKIFKAPLYPLSSPSKTFEGAVFALISCVPITLVLDHHFPEYSFLQAVPNIGLKISLTTLLLIAALSGDLSESILKRHAKMKDSGSLIPGHGGFFDRLDGMLFAGILSYLLLQL